MKDASTALQDLEYFIHLTYQPHYDLNDEQMRPNSAIIRQGKSAVSGFDLVLPEIQQLSMALSKRWDPGRRSRNTSRRFTGVGGSGALPKQRATLPKIAPSWPG